MKSSGRGSRRKAAIRNTFTYTFSNLEGYGRTKKRIDGHSSPRGVMASGGQHKQVCSPTNVFNQAECVPSEYLSS